MYNVMYDFSIFSPCDLLFKLGHLTISISNIFIACNNFKSDCNHFIFFFPIAATFSKGM